MEERAGRKHIRLQNYNYNTPGVYFLTICVENRRCLLSRIKGEGILAEPGVELSPYGEIAEKYINQLNDFYQNLSVESYVIMPNHIHVLLAVKAEISLRETTKQNSAVSRFVSTFKRFCNKEYGHNI